MIDLYCQVIYISKMNYPDSNKPGQFIKENEACYSLYKLVRYENGKLFWRWTRQDSMEPFEVAILLEPDDRAFNSRFPFKESDLLCE